MPDHRGESLHLDSYFSHCCNLPHRLRFRRGRTHFCEVCGRTWDQSGRSAES